MFWDRRKLNKNNIDFCVKQFCLPIFPQATLNQFKWQKIEASVVCYVCILHENAVNGCVCDVMTLKYAKNYANWLINFENVNNHNTVGPFLDHPVVIFCQQAKQW